MQIVVPIILAIIGATRWLGANMATRVDIVRISDRLDGQMEEIRGYNVDHLQDHATPGDD